MSLLCQAAVRSAYPYNHDLRSEPEVNGGIRIAKSSLNRTGVMPAIGFVGGGLVIGEVLWRLGRRNG